MKTDLEGRVALVTGGGSGIGRAICEALLDEGCRVAIADLRPESAVSALTSEYGDAVVEIACDLSHPDDARRAVRDAIAHFGRLDIAVTSAGVYETAGVAAITDEQWARTLAVNLTGTFMTARAAIDAMAPGGWGRVITISSMAALTGGGAGGPAYVASKAGVVGLTKSLAKYAGPFGVTVNSILPGFIETPMTAEIDEAGQRSVAEATPMRRLGAARDIAATVVMLASGSSGFITGAQVNVNGGLVM